MENDRRNALDQIQIRGLRVYAYHGVKDSEKEKGQPFELDITLWTDIRRPGASDRLEDTVNYPALPNGCSLSCRNRRTI